MENLKADTERPLPRRQRGRSKLDGGRRGGRLTTPTPAGVPSAFNFNWDHLVESLSNTSMGWAGRFSSNIQLFGRTQDN
jgi:hypothetical protein